MLIPAAIIVPASTADAVEARAHVMGTPASVTHSRHNMAWIVLGAYWTALLLAWRWPPRDPRWRAALEAALASIAPLWLIAGGFFTGRLDAAQIALIASVAAYAAFLGIPRTWRFNGSARAWLFGGGVAAIALAIGLYAHHWDTPLRAIDTGHVLRYFGWALIQQYLICAVVTSRWLRAGKSRFVAIYLGALTFALMHTPNASLMLATFAGGLCWCVIYLRERALLPIAVSHAVSALILIALLPQDWLYSAEVSARFFQ
ncbi:MAG: CPBP family intramembrane metalloprotease [Proteobacteria bacterium]|nr:CPBP family intramembrane metalloprotease [Pseudomonadota bacterium]